MRHLPFVRSLLVCFYSVLMIALFPLLRVLSLFSPRLKKQMENRWDIRHVASKIAKDRAAKKHGVLFLVSSAGEYEQAKPLLDRISAHPEIFVHIAFHSRSGYLYAVARGETLSYSLSPWDTVWHWGWLYSAVQPSITYIVKYELWPAHLETARQFGRTYLIDARAPRADYSRLARAWKSFLMSYPDRIFTVTDADRDSLQAQLNVPAHLLETSGDTKYDRVIERAEARDALIKANSIESVVATRGRNLNKRIMILGSIYPVDLALVAPFVKEADITSKWLIVAAPHDVTLESVNRMRWLLDDAGIRHVSLSTWDKEAVYDDNTWIIVDSMGHLAEIYAAGDAAYVGGAIHNKVHNVLEPAAYGLEIAFGPRHELSDEAVYLARSGVGQVVQSTADLKTWWTGNAGRDRRKEIKDLVRGMCGATAHLDSTWQPSLTGITQP